MSRQQDTYLHARADGLDPDMAAEWAGIPFAEAVLIEKDIARGELKIPAAGFRREHGRTAAMAKKTKPGDSVTNLTDAKDTVRNAVPKIINLKERRKAINDEIAEIRSTVQAAGVPKRALDHAIRVKEMDPEDRQKFDEGFAIARDAIGIPVSRSLFDMLDERTGADGVSKGNGSADALAAARAHLGGDATADAAA